jgi:hypothetical protein
VYGPNNAVRVVVVFIPKRLEVGSLYPWTRSWVIVRVIGPVVKNSSSHRFRTALSLHYNMLFNNLHGVLEMYEQ